jgi:hypothetical protein
VTAEDEAALREIEAAIASGALRVEAAPAAGGGR